MKEINNMVVETKTSDTDLSQVTCPSFDLEKSSYRQSSPIYQSSSNNSSWFMLSPNAFNSMDSLCTDDPKSKLASHLNFARNEVVRLGEAVNRIKKDVKVKIDNSFQLSRPKRNVEGNNF